MDFKGPYHNVRMRLGNALEVCDLYSIFLHSGHFSVHKGEAFVSYFGLKNSLFTFSERGFSALKLLNNQDQNACNDLKEFFEWDALSTLNHVVSWFLPKE